MTDNALAELYARAFPNDKRPWRADAIAQLRSSKQHKIYEETLYEDTQGALFAQFAADEAEIISLFVDPPSRQKGIAQLLLDRLIADCDGRGIGGIFLEVAKDNNPAISFYRKNLFEKTGLRKAYYERKDGHKCDAILMRRAI